MTEYVADVNTAATSDAPTGWQTPAGGGLHLVTSMEVDGLGRTTKLTDPNGNVTYTVYKDADQEVRVYRGWQSATNTTTGPVEVMREYRQGTPDTDGDGRVYTEFLTFAPSTIPTDNGRPTGNDAITAGNIQSLVRNLTNNAGQVVKTDAYLSLAGVTYSQSATALGSASNNSASGNYHRTRSDYDGRGRLKRTESAGGTVTRNLYDARGLMTSTWVGTDDKDNDLSNGEVYWSAATEANAEFNLEKVASYEYDNGGIGDGNLTKMTQHPEGAGGGTNDRVTTYHYDWRNRLVATKFGDQGGTGESTDVNRQLKYCELDNLGRDLSCDWYDADGLSVADANGDGVPDRPSSSLRRARTEKGFDEQGRVYQTKTVSVDQATGALGGALASNVWYDRRGNVIKTSAPDGLVTKRVYDGANRQTITYQTDGGGDPAPGGTDNWLHADDVTGDVVLEQTEWRYDGNGNAIHTVTKQRAHDYAGTGELPGATLNGPRVVGRHVFYNNSSYDGNDTAANGSDDAAIATDKTALLPGKARSFANYTVYSRGLNGIMIDVAGLANGGSLSASDFDFKVGNDNNPASWASAPAPAGVTVRAGAGAGGSDRITITWADHAIAKWLQVTVKATANTGLAAADVFYFGNLIGDVNGNGNVQGSDVTLVRNAQGSSGLGVNSKFDIDRSGAVDATDVNLTRNSQGLSISFVSPIAAVRASHATAYYDAADRPVAAVNLGTNGGVPVVRTDPIPMRESVGGTVTSVSSYTSFVDTARTEPTGFFVGYTVTIPGGTGAGSRALVTAYDGATKTFTIDATLTHNLTSTYTLTPNALIGTTGYDAAGRPASAIDPNGVEDRTEYDLLGRAMKVTEAYDDGIPSAADDRTTAYTYTGSDNILTMKAILPGTNVFQETKYVYGVSQATGSDIDSNDILGATQYPDKGTGTASSSEQETFAVNAAGERKTYSDRSGSVHTYSYDVLGRMLFDDVTTLGTGVNGAVRKLGYTYDTAGRPEKFTSYSLTGTVFDEVNEVQRVYNGFGQLVTEYQEHAGAVNTATSPKVQYGYTELVGGNHSRLKRVTYPNGRVVRHEYASGLDDTISRLSFLADDSSGSVGTHLEEYSYLGLGTVVERKHPQPGVDLTYVKQSTENTGDGGDQYTGLDRFGRIADQRWRKASDGSHTDRFTYGHDRNGNRLYEENLLDTTKSELYHGGSGYDALDRLTSFSRGTLDAEKDGISGTAGRSQDWSLDALGNWSSVTNNGGTPQTRTHNGQNQLTQVGSNTLAFDGNGNMTTNDEGHVLTYDAWNRLVRVMTLQPEGAYSGEAREHRYDALGRQIYNGGHAGLAAYIDTDSYYDGRQLIEQRTFDGPVRQYVWSGVGYTDQLVLRDRDVNYDPGDGLEERRYVQHDANFNVTAITDASGTVLERYVYDPYGAATILNPDWTANPTNGGSYDWMHLHQSLRFDSVTELYHADNRFYDPDLGRWGQQDPHPDGPYVDGMNAYQYVRSNPVTFLDPFGLFGGGTVVLKDGTVIGIDGVIRPPSPPTANPNPSTWLNKRRPSPGERQRLKVLRAWQEILWEVSAFPM